MNANQPPSLAGAETPALRLTSNSSLKAPSCGPWHLRTGRRTVELDLARRTVAPSHRTRFLALPSHCPQLRLRQPHQPVEDEADEPDRDDGQQDVRVDQAVVFL